MPARHPGPWCPDSVRRAVCVPALRPNMRRVLRTTNWGCVLRVSRCRERRIVLTMPLEHFGYKDGSPGEWVIFQEINKEAAASGFTGPSFEKMDPASQSRVRERVKERMAHLYPEFKRQSEYIENHPRTKTIRNIKAKFGEILGKTATENLTDAQLAEINKAIMQEGSKTDPDWQRQEPGDGGDDGEDAPQGRNRDGSLSRAILRERERDGLGDGDGRVRTSPLDPVGGKVRCQ